MTYKEELQAEVDRLQLQLDKNNSKCDKLIKKADCSRVSPKYKTIHNQLCFEIDCIFEDSFGISDKMRRLKATINIL